MKKYYGLLVIFIFCFLISGCNATYEIDIRNNKIEEKIRITETNFDLLDKANDSGWTMRSTFDSLVTESEFTDELYEINRIENEKENGIEYKSNYTVESINTNLRIGECYQEPKVEINDDIVSIKTGNDFKCYDYYDNFETLKIVIKTNHEVINNNASEVNGNTYIWNITKNSDKNIVFEFRKNYKVSKMIYIYIIGIAVILVAVIIFILKRKNNKNNKF